MFLKKDGIDIQLLLQETQRILSEVEKKEFNVSLHTDNMQSALRESGENINKVLEIEKRIISELQSKFDLVTSSLNVGVWDMELINGQPSEVNRYSDVIRTMLGYKDKTDFPEKTTSWTSNIYPEDIERVFSMFTAHLSDKTGKSPFDITYRMNMKDGSHRWFRATGATMRDKDGNPVRNVGAMFDVHEEKMRTEELNNSEIRFEMINQALTASGGDSEGPWYMKFTGSLEKNSPIWFSHQFRNLIGYKHEKDFPNEFSSWINQIHEEERTPVWESFKKHILDYSGKTELNLKIRMKTKAGEFRWFQIFGHTFRDEKGTPLHVAGTIRDITSFVQKEELEKQLSKDMNVFTEFISQLSSGVNDVTNQAQEIALAYGDAIKSVDVARNSIEKSVSITELIKDISEQINLLGLNAAIEASRVGEAGKGFGVVANEVRKLATNTSNAVGDIEQIMEQINKSVNGILNSIESMKVMVQSQAATTEELSASSEEIKEHSINLLNIIKKM